VGLAADQVGRLPIEDRPLLDGEHAADLRAHRVGDAPQLRQEAVEHRVGRRLVAVEDGLNLRGLLGREVQPLTDLGGQAVRSAALARRRSGAVLAGALDGGSREAADDEHAEQEQHGLELRPGQDREDPPHRVLPLLISSPRDGCSTA
jgi:hypothetical protein